MSRLLLVAVFLMAKSDYTAAEAASLAGPGAAATPRVLQSVEVKNSPASDPQFARELPEVVQDKITAGKKTTSIPLDQQPAVINNNVRQTFARAPGVLVSEQQIPSILSVNYRGLGDPHESEFVMFHENGLPIVSDWLGYPTLYYLPPTQRVERVEFIRGGSGLLYGPQIGPTINFVARRARPDTDLGGSTEQVLGSDGLYSTYNELHGGAGDVGYLVTYDRRLGDGTRDNADFNVTGATASFAWQNDASSRWGLDIYGFESESGEAGRLTQAQYESNRDLVTTPFNRIWVERATAVLSHDREWSDSTSLTAALWHGYQDRFSRRSTAFVPPQAPPAFTTFDRQSFRYTGLDARLRHDWSDHTLTVGTVGYVADSPRSQSRSPRLGDDEGTSLRYRQERDTTYAAVFAENLFRFGAWSLVPAVRVERLELGIDETLKLASLGRPAIDATFGDTETLLGFGATRDLARNQQFYANVSEGYRPFKYDDVGNPTAELAATNDPKPARARNYESGFRGSPLEGFYYDVSLFRIDLSDKIEQRLVNATDIELVNSGDSRHQGVELSAEYDLFAAWRADAGAHLRVFASASFLDAEFTDSIAASRVGKTPAYAPDYVVKAGLLYDNPQGLKIGFVGTAVDEHFWQDSNEPRGSGASFIAAEIPSYTLWDLTAEFRISRTFRLLGGINNVFDEAYYARVRTDGIEPAAARTWYAGAELAF